MFIDSYIICSMLLQKQVCSTEGGEMMSVVKSIAERYVSSRKFFFICRIN